MKIIYYLLITMLSWTVYAQEERAIPAINIALQVEKLAVEAEENYLEQSREIEENAERHEMWKLLHNEDVKMLGNLRREQRKKYPIEKSAV